MQVRNSSSLHKLPQMEIFNSIILLSIQESEGIHVDQDTEPEPVDDDSNDSSQDEQDQIDEKSDNPWVQSGVGPSTSYHIPAHLNDPEGVEALLNFDPFKKVASEEYNVWDVRTKEFKLGMIFEI